MSALIHPKTITVDGLSVRYAEGGQNGPDAILMSPWPESVYAFEPAWPHLAAAAHLVAIDPPDASKARIISGEIPPGELSIDPEADEQLGWVTGWAGAS